MHYLFLLTPKKYFCDTPGTKTTLLVNASDLLSFLSFPKVVVIRYRFIGSPLSTTSTKASLTCEEPRTSPCEFKIVISLYNK
ncbi:hypothetical protein X798_01339 [Onchocerca flexuosa]|uniref:MSP domain-containing protein n=2 Tax=Onchocerca flexuosa TaxID=387005 RepID=A0A183H2I5_9BILA|nr:hypothetical protein X798_01339 [Onchocerca flexuosa]VDO30477.1 unnamed protein product [Onchocerca flexuosa]